MDDLNELPDDLKRALESLDARSERRARAVDPRRVAERVLARLRSEPAEDARPRWQGLLRVAALAAAAVIVLAALSVAVMRIRTGSIAPESAAAALPVELDQESLAVGQADALLKAAENIPVTAAAETEPSMVTVEELDEQELQTLLHDMETLNSGGVL
jgi:hypothetical protein